MDGEMARCLALGGGGGEGGRPTGVSKRGGAWFKQRDMGQMQASRWTKRPGGALGLALQLGGRGGAWGAGDRGPGALGQAKREMGWEQRGNKKSGPLAVGHLRRGEVDGG